MNAPLAGDALDRLRDEQRQILELLDTYARQRRDPDARPAETTRLVELIFTLLRVHDGLETQLLQPALVRVAGAAHPVLQRGAARRAAVREALERVEALSPRDPGHALEMTALANQVRAWFTIDENELYALARERLDLVALDEELGRRQEALLSAGREA